MGNKALAVISFGTTLPDARLAITKLEQSLAAQYPDYDFYRSFTSGMVIRKIAREEGVAIPTPEQLMEQLYANGYHKVICQSLHIIPGLEYEKMCAQLMRYQHKFQKLAIGKPLLYEHKDYLQCCQAVLSHYPSPADHEALVLMGHGSAHFSNSAYAMVENTFRFLGAERTYVATVEGFPDIQYILRRLQVRNIKKVILAPLMIVAGDHAQNDLAGQEENSWRSQLLREGFDVEVRLQGLGEFEEVASIFAAHLSDSGSL